MDEYVIKPAVDETQEFIEIANDFANPLDLVREAVSNAFDARRLNCPLIIKLRFETQVERGETMFVIRISDNGTGMGRKELQSFFDLGNSTRRNDTSTIGEKGHGTKVYFNSKRLVVDTCRDGNRLTATLDEPFRKLHEREIPTVGVVEQSCDANLAKTEITIVGYNNNRRDKFTHARIRDHILWFTKFGTVEQLFRSEKLADVELHLKGLDSDTSEIMQLGHPFPPESINMNKLFDLHLVHAPKYYCSRIVKTGFLPNHPEVKYHAIFSIEGSRVKYDNNEMLRRPGYNAPPGAYTVQERYGVWLCKDFIPIQQKNQWVTSRGTEFTKLHAFFNCQALKLTANRGSIENTPAEILSDIELQVRKIYQDITESDEWLHLAWLEDETDAYNTIEKERKNFSIRVAKANKANIAALPDFPGVVLVEPERESGVYSMVIQLLTLKPEVFPFDVVDYDTHEGIDVIVKSRDASPIRGSRLYYVEFKYLLGKSFNHSLVNLHSIVCWDTELKHGEIVKDINKEERKLSVVSPENAKDYTRYYLDHPRSAHRIEVFVLKDYLPQKLNIAFRPRTDTDLH